MFRQQKDDSDDSPPAKRRKIGKSKSKGKKPVHCTNDELEEESANTNSEDRDNSANIEADSKGARVCLNLSKYFKFLS